MRSGAAAVVISAAGQTSIKAKRTRCDRKVCGLNMLKRKRLEDAVSATEQFYKQLNFSGSSLDELLAVCGELGGGSFESGQRAAKLLCTTTPRILWKRT